MFGGDSYKGKKSASVAISWVLSSLTFWTQDVGVGEPESRRDNEYYSASAERFFTVDPLGGLIASAVLVEHGKKGRRQSVEGCLLQRQVALRQWSSLHEFIGCWQQLGHWVISNNLRKAWTRSAILVRHHAERRDWLEGFQPIFSLGGGTGSGLGTKTHRDAERQLSKDSCCNSSGVAVQVWRSGSAGVQRAAVSGTFTRLCRCPACIKQ
ncbi:hypothetical protein MRX96_003667 [Rhipicephalus microplus]